jgi:hypothetical protein
MRAYLSVFAAVAAGATAALVWGVPASADGAWIEVNPSSIQAGYRVGIRASCQENLNEATVSSGAFGEITLAPEHGFLVGAVTIPADTKPKGYRVRLRCPTGSSASTTLNVIGMDRPTHGPATGGGGLAGSGGGPMVIAGGLATVAVGAGLGVLAVYRRGRRRRSAA